jgi:hypothetical protein
VLKSAFRSAGLHTFWWLENAPFVQGTGISLAAIMQQLYALKQSTPNKTFSPDFLSFCVFSIATQSQIQKVNISYFVPWLFVGEKSGRF